MRFAERVGTARRRTLERWSKIIWAPAGNADFDAGRGRGRGVLTGGGRHRGWTWRMPLSKARAGNKITCPFAANFRAHIGAERLSDSLVGIGGRDRKRERHLLP